MKQQIDRYRGKRVKGQEWIMKGGEELWEVQQWGNED